MEKNKTDLLPKWTLALGIIFLVNAFVLFLYMFYSSVFTIVVFEDTYYQLVWGNFPAYLSSRDQPLGGVFRFMNIVFFTLVLVFGGMMKKFQREKKFKQFWRKMLASAITFFILIILNWLYFPIRETTFGVYILDIASQNGWNLSYTRDFYFDLFEGGWACLNAGFSIGLAINSLLSWLNFRSFSRNLYPKSVSLGALFIALGSIPQLIGLILQFFTYVLSIDWMLYTSQIPLSWVLHPITAAIGQNGFSILNGTSTGFTLVLPTILSVVGFILIGVCMILTTRPYFQKLREERNALIQQRWRTSQHYQFQSSPQSYSQPQLQQQTKMCLKCTASVPTNVKFCIYCGALFGTKNACPECSTPIPENANFCGNCGADIR